MTVGITPKITMIVPTRDRAHTLQLVVPSYLNQSAVTELILVDDGGIDDLSNLVSGWSCNYPSVSISLLRNKQPVGASESRNIGVSKAKNSYVLFCDDDEYLEPGYALACLNKLIQSKAGAVSGRRIYMRENETPEAAVTRFGSGSRRKQPFDKWLCELIAGAHFLGDVAVPFTNTIIVTPTDLAQKFGFDKHYFEGNAYREESDYQMNLHVHNFKILITNDTHSIHLPPSKIKKSSMPTRKRSRSSEIYWSIKHTGYFYSKYWRSYSSKNNIKLPRQLALAWFALFVTFRVCLRPTLLSLISRFMSQAKS